MHVRFLLVACLAMFLAFAASGQTAPSLVMQRVAVPVSYMAGQTVDVTVTITKNDARAVTTLGIKETVPTGWTLEDRYATDPAMRPGNALAKPGSVEFVYLTIPTFPVVFTYRMRTAATDTGEQTISGLALYRFTDIEYQTPTVTTKLIAVGTVAEGEGEGEPGATTDSGCSGCSGCNSAQKVGGSLGDLFASALALMTLIAISRLKG